MIFHKRLFANFPHPLEGRRPWNCEMEDAKKRLADLKSD
jgi:hypothetical protein